jgi:hypothetical protein
MTTATKSRPCVKPARSIRWVARPTAADPQGILRIVCGTDSDYYYFDPLPSDFGRAYRLQKFAENGGDVYNVLLSPDNNHTCECKGFLRWLKPCKHISGLLALLT